MLPLHIKRSSYDGTTFRLSYFHFYVVHVAYVLQIEAATNVLRSFKTIFKKIAAPVRTLTNEAIVQHYSYITFLCCGVALAF